MDSKNHKDLSELNGIDIFDTCPHDVRRAMPIQDCSVKATWKMMFSGNAGHDNVEEAPWEIDE